MVVEILSNMDSVRSIVEFANKEYFLTKKMSNSEAQYDKLFINILRHGSIIIGISKYDYQLQNIIKLMRIIKFDIIEDDVNFYIYTNISDIIKLLQNCSTSDMFRNDLETAIETHENKWFRQLFSDSISLDMEKDSYMSYGHVKSRDNILFVTNINELDITISKLLKIKGLSPLDVSRMMSLTIRFICPFSLIQKIGISDVDIYGVNYVDNKINHISLDKKFSMNGYEITYNELFKKCNIAYNQMVNKENDIISTSIIPNGAMYRVLYTKTLYEWNEIFNRFVDEEKKLSNYMVLNNACDLLRNHKSILACIDPHLPRTVWNNLYKWRK